MLDEARKKFLMKVSAAIAIVVPILFSINLVSATIIDTTWSFGAKSLSRLGISENRLAAAMFNDGCIITGALGAAAGAMAAVCLRGIDRVTGVLYSVSLFLLIFVGAITMNDYDLHYAVSFSFAVCIAVTFLTSIAADIKLKRHPVINIVIAAAAIALMATQPFDVWEVVLVTFVIIWSLLQGIKILMYGGFLERAPRAPAQV